MKNFNWKKLKPHVIAIGIFLIVAIIYCKPVLQGKVLQQSDIIHWKGMAQNSFKYKETHGHFPLWSNSMFSGMPAYQIAMDSKNPIPLAYLHYLFTLFLPKPINFFFLLCVSFYFLSQVLRTDYRIGILGALAYAYSSYSSIIIAVGHETKVQTMGYIPALLAAIILVYQKRYYIGAALSTLFATLMITMNHPQIDYYFIIVAAFMTIAYLIKWIKQKEYKHIAVSFAILAVAAVIGVGANMVTLATTYDYSKATMRNSTLNLDTATNQQRTSSGLPIDYAFGWSYGQAETLSLLVANVYGGSSQGGVLTQDSHLAKLAIEKGVPEEQAAQFASSFPAYWGNQPFTSGPVYLGAVICFLFVLGIIYLKGFDKWWILPACVLAILMSWGKNFSAFNSFLFNYMPLYNKFRAPTMALVIPQLLFPFVAILSLQKLLYEEKDRAAALKKLKTAGYIMLGIFAIAAMLYSSFTYKANDDSSTINYLTQLTQGNTDEANNFYRALLDDRRSLFGKDLLRSLFFAGAAFLFVWLMLKGKIKNVYALWALLLLSSIDVLAEGRRYLNDNSFQDEASYDETNFTASPADLEILKDTGYYRVLNLTKDVFNDALTSYFHNSVGGYHPAKLSVTEDLLNYQLRKQPMNLQVLNMLNTKYVINSGPQNQPVVQQNPGALGACWFVKAIQFVKDPAAEMKRLDNLNPKDTAVVEDAYKQSIPFMPVADSNANIRLMKNDNDIITYQSASKTNQFAVFSEIFYDRGWKAYIDNKETPIVRTDYTLRGLALPAGNHTIRFEFKPASYYNSETIAIIASALAWLIIGFGLFKNYKHKNRQLKSV